MKTITLQKRLENRYTVSDSYYIFFLNSENQWVQSTREVFKNIDDAMDYIGDKKRLKVFKIIQ